MKTFYFYKGPIGKYGVQETDGILTGIWVGNNISFPQDEDACEETPLLHEVYRQLDAYFERKLKTFDLPFLTTGTPFQQKVWKTLQNIPYGTTITYGELAQRIGAPKACRAVGMANSRNPLPILIPCHRVIGSGGKLTGYTGGLDIKLKLMEIEGICLFS